MNQKGGANMWWIIIGAVLALVVLVVLVFMFTDNTDRIKKGLDACYGGECVLENSCAGTVNPSIECPNEGTQKQECCVSTKKKDSTTT
jgi:hypothetical protein